MFRQYFPKGSGVAIVQEHLDEIAAKLNTRPRKRLSTANWNITARSRTLFFVAKELEALTYILQKAKSATV